MLDVLDLEHLAGLAELDLGAGRAREATAAISSIGNSRSDRMLSISRPIPVAPTTTTR
jgi:hypothetical protein